MLILIPAYEPDENLLALIDSLELDATGALLLIIDDGSGEKFTRIFQTARARGAVVLRHERNQGKGRALKTGFAFIEENFPGQDVVTADCDGQHCAADIYAVAREVGRTGTLVLGERHFNGAVPLRSRLGNQTTKLFFCLSTGMWLSDTQTGLRGFPAGLLAWLREVPGEKYEYELNMLLDARKCGIPLARIPIQTIYLQQNESSHFRPIRDSVRIYAPLMKFSLSSLAGFAVDTAALLAFNAVFDTLLPAVLLARLISAVTNFWINRQLVFSEGRRSSLKTSAARYTGLAVLLLAANYALLTLQTRLGVPLLAAKILTEVVLFLSSYAVQKRYLFRTRTAGRRREPDSQAGQLVHTELPQSMPKE